MVVSPYTNDINKIIVQLTICKNSAFKHGDVELEEFFDTILSIVTQWEYDHSQWDFKQDHYRQAVSFLMWVAEDTGRTKNDSPEYFEARFFDRLKSYKALEHRFNERYEKGKKELENNEKK
ncbi:MAG: hypothetical protein IKA54_06685 [Clostridia bacterium]|nr:hypothetical protein [Clostridia bacterium]